MANISDAMGVYKFKFEKDNISSVIEFIKLIELELGKSDYATYFSKTFLEEVSTSKIINESYVDNDGKLVFEVLFDGFGRWSYAENIERTFDWIFEDKKHIEFFSNNKSNIEITIEYVDFELGNEILQEAVGHLVVAKSLDKCLATVDIITSYDITKENYEALGYDSWEDIFEVE